MVLWSNRWLFSRFCLPVLVLLVLSWFCWGIYQEIWCDVAVVTATPLNLGDVGRPDACERHRFAATTGGPGQESVTDLMRQSWCAWMWVPGSTIYSDEVDVHESTTFRHERGYAIIIIYNCHQESFGKKHPVSDAQTSQKQQYSVHDLNCLQWSPLVLI